MGMTPAGHNPGLPVLLLTQHMHEQSAWSPSWPCCVLHAAKHILGPGLYGHGGDRAACEQQRSRVSQRGVQVPSSLTAGHLCRCCMNLKAVKTAWGPRVGAVLQRDVGYGRGGHVRCTSWRRWGAHLQVHAHEARVTGT
eukprot:jgi/Ulvmu1/6530/UM003_0163.1